MGQRTPTETLFGIVAAFVERRRWSQSELARRLETKPETIRRRLGELKAGGFKLERTEEPPLVYWSVPKNWFPGVLPFKAEEARDLLRLLGRARSSELRDRLLGVVVSRLSNLGQSVDLDPDAVRGPAVRHDEERWLAVIEDAVAKKTAVKMRYFTASRRHESWRHVSVHRIDVGARPHFIATCHVANTLRRFRVSNVLEARLDLGERVRAAKAEDLARFDVESFGGFRHDGPAVPCAFVVRDPESAWVARNLPDETLVEEAVAGGIRFRVETSAVIVLARFVVGLGEAARVESPELAEQVATLARGALAGAKAQRARR
ncbi:MAG: WYL domain-containing protein [Labilithrix sp.]|nr:WYL domain-containing protein [Labilithrix sp.]